MKSSLEIIESKISERHSFPRLRDFIEHPVCALIIAVLILISVFLILLENFLDLSPVLLKHVISFNEALTVIFVVELFIRWLVSKSTKSYFRHYWLDIIAVMPMLRVFRLGRIFRLLRIFRIFSLGAVFQRRFSFFGRILHGQILEYSIILGFVFFAVIFGAVGLAQFEVVPGGALTDSSDAFWKAFFSLMSGEYAEYPQSLGGKIVAIILLMFGMGVFAMLTGTFSAVMIEKLKENTMHTINNPEELSNHIIICGFSAKAAILATEFLLDPDFSASDILIVSENADLGALEAKKINTDRITILKEDFTRVEVLKKARVTKAKAAIILSEGGGSRTTQDIDARTLLAALTIERLNPLIHTSAEIYHEEYADHLKMGGVEDVVIQGEVSGKLLARVAMHEGLMAFFKDLLSRQQGNTLSFTRVPEDLLGMEYQQALAVMHMKTNAIIVGIKPLNEQLIVNPAKYKLSRDDELLTIIPVSQN